MDGIRDLIDWIARVQDARETALPEHIRIAEAICNRDVVGAVAAMREHLQNSLARFDANWALPAAPSARKSRVSASQKHQDPPLELVPVASVGNVN